MDLVLFDTNIIIDLFLDRNEDALYANALFSALEWWKMKWAITAISVSTVIYMLQKKQNTNLHEKITYILDLFLIISIDENSIREALIQWFGDLEDAIQFVWAKRHHCTSIISNDKRWFVNSSLPVYTSKQYLDMHL
jgi:predicted nucleic acid-binding protein